MGMTKIYQITIVVLLLVCYNLYERKTEVEATYSGDTAAYKSLVDDLKLDLQISRVKSERLLHEADSINQLFIQSQQGHETNYKNFQSGLRAIRSGTITERISKVSTQLNSADSITGR